jgi:hypothetical protein
MQYTTQSYAQKLAGLYKRVNAIEFEESGSVVNPKVFVNEDAIFKMWKAGEFIDGDAHNFVPTMNAITWAYYRLLGEV